MDQALDADAAWEALHGPHNVPKKYVPPFLTGKVEETKDESEIDRMYELEIERKFMTGKEKRPAVHDNTSSDEEQLPKNVGAAREATGGNGHVSEMKFIKVKINTLKVENEELLH